MELKSRLEFLKAERAALEHNLAIRTKEVDMCWHQVAQLDASLCKTLGRQWTYEDFPADAATSGVWQFARDVWNDQLKPIPVDPAIPGEDPSSS
jgi:hypothetical protein